MYDIYIFINIPFAQIEGVDAELLDGYSNVKVDTCVS